MLGKTNQVQTQWFYTRSDGVGPTLVLNHEVALHSSFMTPSVVAGGTVNPETSSFEAKTAMNRVLNLLDSNEDTQTTCRK